MMNSCASCSLPTHLQQTLDNQNVSVTDQTVNILDLKTTLGPVTCFFVSIVCVFTTFKNLRAILGKAEWGPQGSLGCPCPIPYFFNLVWTVLISIVTIYCLKQDTLKREQGWPIIQYVIVIITSKISITIEIHCKLTSCNKYKNHVSKDEYF